MLSARCEAMHPTLRFCLTIILWAVACTVVGLAIAFLGSAP